MKKFNIVYYILLLLFTLYVLLDVFVIPKKSITITENNSEDNTNIVKEVNENSYKDNNIEINIETITRNNTQVYVADIKISNINYLKTAFANNTYGLNIKETTSDIATSNNAILAINGDYYGFRKYGYVLRNGIIYRTASKTDDSEDLIIYNDGSFKIMKETDMNIDNLKEEGAIQIFSFGPGLIEDNNLTVTTSSEVSQSKQSNPRTAIGIIDSLHYVFVVSDGRTSKSEGLTLYELALIMQELGCQNAYNLDGGGSSTMWFNGNLINNPTDGNKDGERKVSDIVYVGY